MTAARIAGKGRPAIPVKVQVSVAIRQASVVTCPLCQKPLWATDARRLEHMVPRKLGGSDEAENLRWVHELCAINKDFGKSKATCADGDIHKIAKAKRLNTARQIHEAAKRGEYIRPPSRLKGRGFEGWRKFNGDTVRK